MTDQVKHTNKLRDSKVLVIGGSSGIGFAVAESLVEHGATVTVSSSNPARVQATVDTLKKSYPSAAARIHGHACNLGDASTADANVKELFEKTGKLDHVVCTAGDGLAMLPVQDLTVEKMHAAGQVRFFAPLLIAKHAVAYLNPGPRSSITLCGGSVADRPIPGWALVNSFATGLQGMARGLAVDLKPLRVNLVQPGIMDTNLWASSGLEEAKPQLIKDSEERLPTGKIGAVEDVTEAFLYCIRDGNVTGEIINSSGGHLLV